MEANDIVPIGTLARRTGLAVSAIRFYEDKGLITALRTAGNQRRFHRSDIRRLSFIMIGQKMGLALDVIEGALCLLPTGRVPNSGDWQRVNRTLRTEIDSRIQLLSRARTQLDQCIGCGCLSLDRCAKTNRGDRAGACGTGPRYVLN